MISAKIKNSFYDGVRTVIFHKSELVETIASLHSLYAEKSEKLHSLKNLEEKLAREERFSTFLRTSASGSSSSPESIRITASGSSTWLWTTETVQTVRLEAMTVPFRSTISPLAALMVRSLSWRSSAMVL